MTEKQDSGETELRKTKADISSCFSRIESGLLALSRIRKEQGRPCFAEDYLIFVKNLRIMLETL